jgi:hypothetical protein
MGLLLPADHRVVVDATEVRVDGRRVRTVLSVTQLTRNWGSDTRRLDPAPDPGDGDDPQRAVREDGSAERPSRGWHTP